MPDRPADTYSADTYSLVADIGGTNTRVAVDERDALLPETVQRFRNAEYDSLEQVLRAYLSAQGDVDCAGACVAVAGPVRDGVGALTNLDWRIDAATLARASRAETVSIINDLQAQGHALDRLAPDKLRPLIGRPGAPGARLVIGIGTGFNVSPAHALPGGGALVLPSEAGHANMPIRTEEELRLCRFVETAHGFPAIEDVLSGRGLERIYAWRGAEAGDPRELPAAQIMAGFEAGTDPRAAESARVFARILGTVAGNLALIHLPFGGIFLVGGVARAFAPHLAGLGFAEAFRDKGRFADFMRDFPVAVIEDDYAALAGCAAHLASNLNGEPNGELSSGGTG